MSAQLFMAVVVEALDGRVLDGAVHSLDLSVGPWVVNPGEPVLNAVLVADAIEDVVEGIFVAGVVSELDAVVGQHCMDGVGDRRDHLARFLGAFDVGELRHTVDGYERTQLTFGCLHLGDIDVEEADRAAFKHSSGKRFTGLFSHPPQSSPACRLRSQAVARCHDGAGSRVVKKAAGAGSSAETQRGSHRAEGNDDRLFFE